MRWIGCALVLVFGVFISTKAAYSTGIGLYITGGGSISNWKYEKKNYGSTTNYYYGGGLIVDTAAAKNTLFNYRVSFGYERYGSDNTSLFQTETSKRYAHKFDLSQTFGFRIYQAKAIRLWAGPEIGLNCLYSNNFQHIQYSILAPYPIGDTGWATGYGEIFLTSPTKKMLAIGFEALLALGINFNIGELTTLFTHVGFGYMGTYQLRGDKEIGYGCGAKIKIGVLFRLDDSYELSPLANQFGSLE
jgi:hypothetical protein